MIIFFSEDQVSKNSWIKAHKIVEEIDPKDTPYVAFANFLGIKIWTGDKGLRAGLLKKGYDFIITNDDLFEYRALLLKK